MKDFPWDDEDSELEPVSKARANQQDEDDQQDTAESDVVEQPRRASRKEKADDIIWVGNPCWKAMIGYHMKSFAVFLIVAAAGYGLSVAGLLALPLVILLGLLTLAGALAIGYFMRRMTIYTITRSRVMKKSGIINTRKEQARIEMITNILIDRNLSQRLMGIGDLDIDTANDTTGTMIWWGLRDPYDIEEIIDNLRDARDD